MEYWEYQEWDDEDDYAEDGEEEEDCGEESPGAQDCDHRNYRIYKVVDRVCRVSCFNWLAAGRAPCGKVYRWFVWYACDKSDCRFIWESGISDDCGGHGDGPHRYGYEESYECYTEEELDENGRRKFGIFDGDIGEMRSC